MSDKLNPEIRVYPATDLADVELLHDALTDSIRSPITGEVFNGEVEGVKRQVQRAKDGEGERYYAVAETSGGVVLGSMGLSPLDEAMREFVTTTNPIEIVNAYTSHDSRRTGTGRLLVRHLEEIARERGHTEVLLNSGPRYMRSGWPFWKKIYGEPVGQLDDFYGQGFHAKVWQSIL